MQQSGEQAHTSRRVPLSKHRAEIEQWVGEGCSDEWIANTLGTTRSSVQSFRSRSGILRRRGGANGADVQEEGRTTDSPEPEEASASVFEGVLDQGEEGYGLWLDPAVADDSLFREGFTGVSDVRVVIEAGRIVLEPASDQSAESGEQPEKAKASDTPADRQTAVDGVRSQPEQPRTGASSGGEPGRVKFFDSAKGYGFITRPDGGEVFFHRSELQGDSELESGEYVLYEPGSSQRGPIATRVRAAG